MKIATTEYAISRSKKSKLISIPPLVGETRIGYLATPHPFRCSILGPSALNWCPFVSWTQATALLALPVLIQCHMLTTAGLSDGDEGVRRLWMRQTRHT